ncbi:MAG: hypothetical protein L0211_02115 [Planctomycetaceae bacterium]|nr:hypothetical protein [Planctomycetaceae bacterium]
MSRVSNFPPIAIAAALGLAIGTIGCNRSAPPADAAASAGSPVAPERPAAPPAHSVAVATAAPAEAIATGPSLADRLKSLGATSPEVEAHLREASFDGGASSSLVVLAGGRQTDVARPAPDRHERWEIRFPSGTSVEAYARQLDFFKIELGVIGGQQQVTYLTNLSNPKPTSRQGDGAADRRLYLIWQRGAISEVDRQIATRAGLTPGGAVIVHFLPKEVEEEMSRLEDAFARQLKIAKIAKTVFGITSSGQDSYRFYVIEQKADLR